MLRPDFDAQPILESDELLLRPLHEADFDSLFAAAGHPEVWAGHPAKDRYKRDVFEKYFHFLLMTGSTLAIIDKAAGKAIGCSRYYAAPDVEGSVSIGFTFLNHAYWGGTTNFEMKRLMLGHAFKTVSEVWFHIDPTNIRSQKATAKLGARHIYDAMLDFSGTPAKWMCFRLDEDRWARAARERAERNAETR